ncbi:MAG: hypothetical protein NVSMB66_5080 [Candidatus Doudnabacteria bacterium]
MVRNPGESHHQYELELNEEIRVQGEEIWRQLLDGNAENITKIDQKFHRLVAAFLESKSVPVKEVLDPFEAEAAEDSLRNHEDFAGEKGEVRLDHVPKLIFDENVTDLTNQEAELIAGFKGLVLMNFVKKLTPEQAQKLAELKAPLFIKGLEPEKDASITTPSGIMEATLPEDINKILSNRDYYTGVGNHVLTAFQIARSNRVWNGHTVEMEKPE